MGYIRAKVYNRSILLKVLIDSGNLFADLISEKLAKTLNLQIYGSQKNVGTASTQGSVTVLGRTKPFRLYLEGIQDHVLVHPYVVRDLAHPLNLGQAFLRLNSADMTFRSEGIQLRLNGSVSKLAPVTSNLSRSSIDTRISKVLGTLKEQGGNPEPLVSDDVLDLRVNEVQPEVPGINHADKKKPLIFGDTKFRLYNKEKVLLKAGMMTVVNLGIGHPDKESVILGPEVNNVFLFPKQDHNFMNRKELLAHPGSYLRQGNEVKILVSNLSKTDTFLPAKCKLGHILEGDGYEDAEVNVLDHRPVASLSEKELVERRSFIISSLKLDENAILNKNPSAKDEVIKIFMDNWDALAISDTDYGRTDLMKFHINIPAGTQPVRSKVRPLNPVQEEDLARQLREWTEAQVIEPSMSPWASALVPCKKKGTSRLRWCLDYRKLNLLTVKDAYPLASIEGNLHKLSGATFFSTLDSAGAFHNIVIAEECRDYTSFVTPFGMYRFTRLPFGLCNAPSAYSRLVQMALDRLPKGFALGYIDDIIIHSRSLEDHIDHLRQVVALHKQCGLRLNLAKCHVVQEEVEYLGHLVSEHGVKMIPSYVERILEWTLPTTGKDLRSFLGFTGYYRAFIKEYGNLTAEMNKMKMETQVTWTEATEEKFKKLKQCFKEAPLRGYPDYNSPEPFILDTDYSALNMAAVLSQKQNGREVFLGCVAKKCNQAQSSYSSHKGEMASVILGLKKFEHILSAREFIIRTDSQCVKYLHTMKEFRGIWARWQVYLASFRFKLVHRAGKQQTNADALSRMPGLAAEADDNTGDIDPLHDVDDIYTLHALTNQEITKDDLRTACKADSVLVKVMDFVREGQKPSREERKPLTLIGMTFINVFEMLTVDDGILYFQYPDLNGKKSAKRICLPVSMYDIAFKLCHEDPMNGHVGMNNTYNTLKARFYFPHMYSYVQGRINNCIPCLSKHAHLSKPVHKQHREELSYFNQRVYSDTVGPLTGALFHGKMCRHFLTIQDGYTRYLICVPVENIEAKTLAAAIVEHWCFILGCPEVLHSDRGSSFTSELFREVMNKLNIVKTVTPAYCPSSDRVERAHRTLGDIIRADRQFEARAWPAKLVLATMAYNTCVNRMIGVSPYEAMFGRPAILPVDLVFPFDRKAGRSWSNYLETQKLWFSDLSEKICKYQNTGIMRDNSRFQARSGPTFKVGDRCYYFLGRVKRGLSKKLQTRWIGPFEVKTVVSEALVVIYPVGSWSTNPREIATTIQRLRKVDPQEDQVCPQVITQVDLESIGDDLDEASEYLTYQDDFEERRPHSLMSSPPSGPPGTGTPTSSVHGNLPESNSPDLHNGGSILPSPVLIPMDQKDASGIAENITENQNGVLNPEESASGNMETKPEEEFNLSTETPMGNTGTPENYKVRRPRDAFLLAKLKIQEQMRRRERQKI